MNRGNMRNFLRLLTGALLVFSCAGSAWAGGTVTNCTEAAFTNALSGGGTVTFACNGSIVFTSTKIVSVSTILNANGYNVTLNGQNGGTKTRLFYVNTNVSLTMSGLKLVNGLSTNGGAIFNNGGTVNATNCVFAFNSAIGPVGTDGASIGDGDPGRVGTNGCGGALFNLGVATFHQCTFATNSAVGGNGGRGGNGESALKYGGDGGLGGDGLGGAAYNNGQLLLASCSLNDNFTVGGDGGNGGDGNGQRGGPGGVGGRASGGAIFSDKVLSLTDCTITNGWSHAGDGGDGGAGGTATSVGRGGQGGQGSGGAIYNLAYATNLNSVFAWNFAQSGNSKHGGVEDGGALNSSGVTGPSSFGGGVCNLATNIVLNCTFFANTVTGGDGGDSLAGFSGASGGNGGHGWGGNLFSDGRVLVTNCTAAAGGAQGGAGGTGGSPAVDGSKGSSRGGNIANNGGAFILHNTILAYPSIGTNGYTTGTIFTDAGFCISSDRSVDLDGSGSRTNTNPVLGPLTTNGGPTMTMAVLAGSPCIDGGDTNFTFSTDQRSNVRPGGGRGDIGAYESMPTVSVFPDLGWASESGDVAVISLNRNEGTAPLTVNFTIGGNAGNGTDYVSVPNSVTIAQGASTARVIVRPLVNGGIEPDETVTLTLQSGTNYLAADPVSGTVTISETVVRDPDKRYLRGSGTYAAYHSFVVPLDFQRGVRLADIDGNATNLFAGNPWTTNLYHFDATNPAPQVTTNGRIVFRNPIVAFGSRVGGSPLLVNQAYRFGVYAGANETTNLPQFRLKVYNKTTMAVVNTVNVNIPPEWSSNV